MTINKQAADLFCELWPEYGEDFWRHAQYKRPIMLSEWTSCECVEDFLFCNTCEYRRKPATHFINGIECPAPMSERVGYGCVYWMVHPCGHSGIGDSEERQGPVDERRFERGNYFATEADAFANFYAHYPHMKDHE